MFEGFRAWCLAGLLVRNCDEVTIMGIYIYIYMCIYVFNDQ